MQPPTEYPCVDCDGTCHLISRPDEDGHFHTGDLLTYRCSDCMERFDLILNDPGTVDEG
ncbi:MAG: hypothetical protein ABI276_00965 [Acidimicrobiales bacterium]